MVKVSFNRQVYRLEAWVHVPLLSRIPTLMLMPGEMVIDSRGAMGALQREKARKQVNQLLSMLGVQPFT